jgi:hypothetical protein
MVDAAPGRSSIFYAQSMRDYLISYSDSIPTGSSPLLIAAWRDRTASKANRDPVIDAASMPAETSYRSSNERPSSGFRNVGRELEVTAA